MLFCGANLLALFGAMDFAISAGASEDLIFEINVCVEPLSRGPCKENEWVVLKPGYSRHGHCVPRPCPEGRVPLKGRCLKEGKARKVLCGGGPLYMDLEGVVHCGTNDLDVKKFCAILYHSALKYRPLHPSGKIFFLPRNETDCTWYEKECWSHGQLLYDGGCYQPLSRGPCPQDHWLVMDRKWVRGRCVPRPCPQDLLPFKGRCLSQANAKTTLCEGMEVHLDEQGLLYCGKNFRTDLCSPEIKKWICESDSDSYYDVHGYQKPFEKCILQNRLPMRGGGCVEPLSRGPCKVGQWVVKEPGENMRGHCVPRPCPQGLVPLKGHCLTERKASKVLCGGRDLHIDLHGILRCGLNPKLLSLCRRIPCRNCAPGVVAPPPVSCAKVNGAPFCSRRIEDFNVIVDLSPEY